MSWGQFTYSEIDDSIFEHLRRYVVAQGYYPDLTLFVPENTTNRTAFDNALAVIKGTGKTPINTIANGVFANKGEMALNSLYIHRIAKDKGSVAIFDTESVRTDGLNTPPDENTPYARIKTHGFTQNISYEVRFLSNTQVNADLMSAFIHGALTFGIDYFDIFDLNTGNTTPEKQILLEFAGEQDLNLFDYKEFVFRFNVIDAWIVNGDTLPDGVQTIVNPNIVPIKEINLNLETD